MKTADATGMFQFSGEAEPLLHGGDVAAARRLFPGAPQPFIDLSTGINPHSYRLPRLSADLFERLPSSAATVELAAMHRLHPVLNLRTESNHPQNRAAGVNWTRLAFIKMTSAD